MEQSDAELTVARRLGQLLDRGLLPAGGPAEAAERLIERLERPARVALLGLPGAGKSAILNLLTGAVVIPETLRLPTIIVQHGLVPRMQCTLTDGRTEVVPGTDLNDVLTLNPALVTLEMDLPALKVISLLEVSAGPMEAEQRRAAIWASKRADILIWCTTSYLPKEQQVWEGMPDVVKDNGFLFLTKIDLLGNREAAAGMLERVEMRAGEEFRQILAISAKQARDAMPQGEPLNREMFRDSGAAAVITTIKSRVQAARRADTDMAELLLARHVEAGGIVARRFAEPGETTPPAIPSWTPPPEVPAYSEPVVENVSAEAMIEPAAEPAAIADPEPLEVPDPEPAVVTEVPEPAPLVEPEPTPQPAPKPTFTQAPEPEPDAQPAEGRKRFSDRIKQMPALEDAPAVPLRSTWKSKAETSAARTSVPESAEPGTSLPDHKVSPEGARPLRADSRARPVSAKEPEPQNDDETLARMLASVTPSDPQTSDEEATPDAEGLVAEEMAADDLAAEDLATAEDESPRWAERLKPVDAGAPADRTPRTSLFGARKTVVAAAPAIGARSEDRVARPTEPVTRMRAPAPRPSEPQRPSAPLPEHLATPRIVPIGDRLQTATGPGEPPRAERRERPRIARILPAEPAAGATLPIAVPAAEKDLLDEAIRHVMARSAELESAVDPDEKIPVDMILEHGRETVEQVLAILGTARSVGLRRILGDIGEIQDIIMLMQLEKGHAPADDALTLLLQIRRDLETLRTV